VSEQSQQGPVRPRGPSEPPQPSEPRARRAHSTHSQGCTRASNWGGPKTRDNSQGARHAFLSSLRQRPARCPGNKDDAQHSDSKEVRDSKVEGWDGPVTLASPCDPPVSASPSDPRTQLTCQWPGRCGVDALGLGPAVVSLSLPACRLPPPHSSLALCPPPPPRPPPRPSAPESSSEP